MADIFDSIYQTATLFIDIPTVADLKDALLKEQVHELVEIFKDTTMSYAKMGKSAIAYYVSELKTIAPLVDLDVFAADLRSKSYKVYHDDETFVVSWEGKISKGKHYDICPLAGRIFAAEILDEEIDSMGIDEDWD